MPAGIKANVDGSAAIQVGGSDVITLTSGGAATFLTSPTTVQAGTAAAPSITFSGDTNTGIYSPGADTVGLTAGGTLVGSVGLGTTLALQGATSQSGTGITFPATQSASSNANTLDDYEEGSWTPTATPSTGSLTSSTRNGSYVKIGNVVVARFSILLTNVGTAGGTMTIGALPFTVENVTGRSFIALVREDDQTGTAYQGCPIGNTTTASVHTLTNGSIAWTNNYRYVGCFTYIVA